MGVNLRDIHDGDIEEEIREAFRCFDKDGNGFIPVPGDIFIFSTQLLILNFPDLSHVLQTFGDKLSDVETQVRIM